MLPATSGDNCINGQLMLTSGTSPKVDAFHACGIDALQYSLLLSGH